MTKIYPLIHLNGFIYIVDKETEIQNFDWVFHIGLCNLEDLLWRKGNCLQQVMGILHTNKYIRTNHSQNHIKLYCPPKQLIKIIASNDKSLGLPLLPDIEEDWQTEAKKMFPTEELLKTIQAEFWKVGYKAAKAKRYTEEDMRSAMRSAFIEAFEKPDLDEGGKPIGDFMDNYLQSLNPLPKFVEVEMSIYASNNEELYDSYDSNFMTVEYNNPKIDENNYINILKWIYES